MNAFCLKLTIIFALVLSVLFIPAKSVSALDVPALSGRVNDYAGMLSGHTEQQLDTNLGQLEKTDSTQIVVLTIPSLEGDNLEDFSIRVAEAWGVGHKGKDNGAILLIAKKERKIRIEVGYGLEGSLTDMISGRIIRNIITPNFKSGNFDKGVLDGVQAMIGVVKGKFKGQKPGTQISASPPDLFGFFVVLMLINMLGRLRRSVGTLAGGFLIPLAGWLTFGLSMLWVLALIPAGVLSGLLISYIGRPLSFSDTTSGYSRRGGGYYDTGGYFGGGGFGGYGGGGFGGGGFGGGGGGFGGGGASGGW